jgi:type VI secretion system protein ImpG
MSLNYLSLVQDEALRAVLSAYNFRFFSKDESAKQAHRNRMHGIKIPRVVPTTKVLQDTVMRGLRIDMEMQESQFAGEGEVYLFAAVLNEFFSLYATINVFHALHVKNVERNIVYKFPVKIGTHQLL